MRILTLSLEHFRSYDQRTFDFSEGLLHILLGPNGAGKTNVIEAISILSLTRSALGAEENDLITWGKDFYRLRTEAQFDASDRLHVEVVSQVQPRKRKACFLNDVHVAVSDIVGALPTVTFLPQDLDLFSGSPAIRRGLLDQLLCQVSPEYLRSLSTYNKILRQRNALLRRIADGTGRHGDLDTWDQRLASEGAFLTLRRLELLEVLQLTLPQELKALGEQWHDAQLVYERKGEARTREDIEKEMVDMLLHYRERDVILQATSVGPHRHDWHVSIAGRPIATFASRGQQRAAILALLFLQVSYLELQRGEKPVILLDDVFSELDDEHQVALLHSLHEHQIIITTTHLPSSVGKAKVWDFANPARDSSRASKVGN